jgi:hypothetical protein
MDVSDLLNRGPSQASFGDTLIYTPSEALPAPGDIINSVESLIVIDHPFDYMPPPPLLISITPKPPPLGHIGRLGSIKRTPAPSELRIISAVVPL